MRAMVDAPRTGSPGLQLERALAVDLAARFAADAARVLEDAPPAAAAAVLCAWEPDVGAGVLEAMSPHLAAGVVAAAIGSLAIDAGAAAIDPAAAPGSGIAGVLAAMERPAAALVLRRLAEDVRERVLATLPEDVAAGMRARLRYPEGTAAALADADALCLPPSLTAGEAMRRVRAAPRLDNPTVFVIDEHGKLIGVFDLRDLFVARPRVKLGDIMTRDVQRLAAAAVVDEIVSHPGWRALTSLPVVDDDGRPLGALRWRRARAIEQELRGASDEGIGEAAHALGELFLTGLSGAVDALTLGTAGDVPGGGKDGPHGP